MNPYETNPDKIPEGDRYRDEPSFGRYCPRPDDFRPDPTHFNSSTPESLEYWASLLKLCDVTNRIYENGEGGRDVFALGAVIVKSSHLGSGGEGRRATRDYSYADRNEMEAVSIVRDLLENMGIKVPKIYFAGHIASLPVLVQERIPGIGLNVAWQYLSPDQKKGFKQQARHVLNQLRTIKPPVGFRVPSYIVPDPDPVEHRGIQTAEHDILFSDKAELEGNYSLMHNDFSESNTIVDNDKIVGLVDWEMAGFFSFQRAAEVHVRIRGPQRESFAALSLSEDFLRDILYWNDLYSF